MSVWICSVAVALAGCAAAPDDRSDATENEAELSTLARRYVGEYVEITSAEHPGRANSIRLLANGKYAADDGSQSETGHFTVGNGRKVRQPDYTHAYENRTVEVQEDLLRLTPSGGAARGLYVRPLHAEDATTIISTPDDGTTPRFFARLRASSCGASTCNALTACIDVQSQSGETRAVCVDPAVWRVGSGT